MPAIQRQDVVGHEQPLDALQGNRSAPFDVTVERAPVGIAHFDRGGKFLYANPQLCTIFGLAPDALLQRTFQEVSFPDDLPRCLILTQQLATGAIPKYAVEKRFVRPDGSQIYTRVIVTAVREAGEIAFFLGIVEDLSDQWAAEQARRGAEERLALALEASGTGIYRYDIESKALDWSNGLARVFGFPEGDVLHTLERLLSAIHPGDLPNVVSAFNRSLSEGCDFDEEFRVVLPDGSVRWISDCARMTLDENGRPKYLTGACTDITKRRDAEVARLSLLDLERNARADAERATQLRDEMLAIVAHDLRNPLHTILMSVGAAVDLPLSPADSQIQLALIQRSARGMDALIRDLLDVTQIETGRLSINPIAADISTIIDDAIIVCSKQAVARGLRLETDVPPGLPHVHADPTRITQVLGNLLGNALKFTPGPGRVVVRARQGDDIVMVAVEDTGRGIAPDDVPRVFDRYWQAHRGSRDGVGLGLTIVRGIIEAHGGWVDVESEVGVGTTFRIALPVAR